MATNHEVGGSNPSGRASFPECRSAESAVPPPLNLSRELVQNLMRVLQQHDERVRDPRFGAQYLAALMGLLVGNDPRPAAQKRELLDELTAFSRHVLDDVLAQAEAQAAPPAPDPDKAFGVWKPPARP